MMKCLSAVLGDWGPGDQDPGAQIATLPLQSSDRGPSDWGPGLELWGPDRLEPLSTSV